MKLPTFLAIFAAGAIAASGIAYTLNQVNASHTAPQAQLTSASTSVQGSPTQTNGVPTTEQAQADTETVQFICSQGYDPDTQAQVPTTYAWTPKGKISIVRWKSDWFAGSGFTPEVRCSEVSPRFDTAYQNGNLNYLTNGRLNSQKVICAVRESGDSCAESTLILTLRPEDDELIVLDQLNSLLKGDARIPVGQSSEQLRHPDGTQKIYLQLDIENFLATAPVEEESVD